MHPWRAAMRSKSGPARLMTALQPSQSGADNRLLFSVPCQGPGVEMGFLNHITASCQVVAAAQVLGCMQCIVMRAFAVLLQAPAEEPAAAVRVTRGRREARGAAAHAGGLQPSPGRPCRSWGAQEGAGHHQPTQRPGHVSAPYCWGTGRRVERCMRALQCTWLR